MIENEFVPYQEALELKELGFDERCFGYFDNTQVKGWLFDTDLKPKTLLFAPTYSQAFRWFRKKYGIEGQVKSWKEKGGIIYHYSTQKIGEPSIFRSIDCAAPTYEEAELPCLRKLIEIVKNDNDQRYNKKDAQ